jgi:hypothetical protein
MAIGRTIGVVVSILLALGPMSAARAGPASADPARIGWIGLYTDELIAWLENENRLSTLCGVAEETAAWYGCRTERLAPKTAVVRLRTAPARRAAHAGDLVITAIPGKGLHAGYVSAIGGRAHPITPDLYDGDWGYGPYFHMTIVERRGAWIRLPDDPFPPSTWLNVDDLGPASPFRWLEPGEIVTSPIGDLFVLGVGPALVRARPEQARDMPCDADEQEPVAPFTEVRLTGPTLYTPTGHLRLRIKYTRGC